MNDQELIARVIHKLTTSVVPPNIQEHILNNLGELHKEQMYEVLLFLGELQQGRGRLQVRVRKLRDFYAHLGSHLRGRLFEEVGEIEKEFNEELYQLKKAV